MSTDTPADALSAWELVTAILSRRGVSTEYILAETGFDTVDALIEWARTADAR
ncbi:hypothetical protein [Mycolicibacterium fluoranthenivorans]|uniref:Uncharacterized protein n=1 Tax=Mycolicibacterium fluoranthenivorans TaxID=258505 RepID=A0A7X5ZD45_9MYCO|nr:hypothetical protein [Mycolicibacterium fluoranthenivorans]MCV7358153.1 hypothetical protein [Mycolicibacterium fluoranthenivorans]NIH95727.1 hypothetical protein [Mycolicibacterium fluoranthenivorans]